jgi:hypothetical protein
MKKKKYTVTAKVWLYPGENGAWHFLTVPKNESSEIAKIFHEFKKGWGSLPVEVIIGKTTWNTSIFPDRKSGTYLLPLKAQVRKKEGIQEGDSIKFTLKILV